MSCSRARPSREGPDGTRRAARGVTLIELVVGMGIALLVLGACVGALAASARLVAAVGGRAEVEDTAQLAVEAFRFDVAPGRLRPGRVRPRSAGRRAARSAHPAGRPRRATAWSTPASEEVTRWLCATAPPRLSRIIGAQSLPVAAPVSRCELHYLDAAGVELPAAGGLDAAEPRTRPPHRARASPSIRLPAAPPPAGPSRSRCGGRHEPRRRDARGAALPAALVVVAVAAAVSAALGALAQTEVLLARSREASARALAAADGCAADVVADLPAGWEFDALLAGADGVAGTPDDGERTAPSGCAAVLRAAPGPAPATARAARRRGASPASGRRIVEAVVGARRRAGRPGADLARRRRHRSAIRGGTLALDGADAARPAAGALRAARRARRSRRRSTAGSRRTAAQVTVTPPGAASLSAPPPPVAELATRMRAAGAAPTGTLVPAGSPPLALTLVTGDLAIGATALGRGLLLVDGLLDITGTFEFNGVVVASAGIRVATGARLDVRRRRLARQRSHARRRRRRARRGARRRRSTRRTACSRLPRRAILAASAIRRERAPARRARRA